MGFDLGASLSASATSGLAQDFRGSFGGPFIVGRGASGGASSTVWIAALAVVAVGLVVWIVRR